MKSPNSPCVSHLPVGTRLKLSHVMMQFSRRQGRLGNPSATSLRRLRLQYIPVEPQLRLSPHHSQGRRSVSAAAKSRDHIYDHHRHRPSLFCQPEASVQLGREPPIGASESSPHASLSLATSILCPTLCLNFWKVNVLYSVPNCPVSILLFIICQNRVPHRILATPLLFVLNHTPYSWLNYTPCS